MDKKSYLKELQYHIRALPMREQKLILENIEDRFKIGALEGKDNQTLILEFGPPDQIASHYSMPIQEDHQEATFRDSVYDSPRQTTHMGRLIVVIILNVLFIIGPVIGFYGFLFGGWALIVTSLFSPVIWLASLFWRSPVELLSEGSLIAVITGTALIASSLWYQLSKGTIYLTKKYIHVITQWVKG